MTILINTLKDQKILEVIYTPDAITKEDLSEQRNVLAEKLTENKFNKVLIDATALNFFPPIFSIYDHNIEVASQSAFWTVKFAVICNSLGNDERFLETSGVNRGVQIKCVTSKNEALLWLNNG